MKNLIATLMMIMMLGCMGVIINGSSQDISINSLPSDAAVKVDGAFVGVTPIILDLSRSESHFVEIYLEGYVTEAFNITRSTDGGIIVLDILLTGGIGLLIDMSTGSIYKLSPEQIDIELYRNVSVQGNDIFITMRSQ